MKQQLHSFSARQHTRRAHCMISPTPVSSCISWSDVLRGRPGRRFQSSAGYDPARTSADSIYWYVDDKLG